ncbi:hypothetical protein Aduo_009012 [Ancylostoma duodenale]
MRLLFLGVLTITALAQDDPGPGPEQGSTSTTEPSTSVTEPSTSATDPSTSDSTTSATSLPSTDASTVWPPLPPVDDVSYVEFKRECTENGNCEFTLVAPHDDQKVLAKEQDEINEDKGKIEDISKKIDEFSGKITVSTTEAEKKIKELSEKMESIRKLLDTFQEQLKEMEGNMNDAEQQLTFPQKYIEMLALNEQMCYSKCITEASTPTPSTTAASSPSTTPSPCDDYVCNNEGKCDIDSDGRPYCKCPGNLDGHQHCDTGVCSEEPITILIEKEIVPFVSPGLNWTDNKSPTDHLNEITCIWKLESPGGYTANDLKFDGFDTETSELTFYYGSGSEMKATNKLDKDMLQKALSGPPITIQFTANKDSKSHFYWTMTAKENDKKPIEK